MNVLVTFKHKNLWVHRFWSRVLHAYTLKRKTLVDANYNVTQLLSSYNEHIFYKVQILLQLGKVL